METLKDRVSTFCTLKKITVSKFEKDSGLSNGYFQQVKFRPGADKIEGIRKAFPDLNMEWLLSGHGQMLTTATHIGDNSISTHGSSRAEVNYFSGGEIEAMKKENDALRAENDYLKNLNAKYLSIIENLTTPKL